MRRERGGNLEKDGICIIDIDQGMGKITVVDVRVRSKWLTELVKVMKLRI